MPVVNVKVLAECHIPHLQYFINVLCYSEDNRLMFQATKRVLSIRGHSEVIKSLRGPSEDIM